MGKLWQPVLKLEVRILLELVRRWEMKCHECKRKAKVGCFCCKKTICETHRQVVMIRGDRYKLCEYCSVYDLELKLLKRQINVKFNPELVS